MLGYLVVIQIVVFVGLVIMLRILFARHLQSALSRLKRLHQENLARENQLKEEIAKARRERRDVLAQAKEQAQAIVNSAKTQAQSLADDSQKQAQRKSEQTVLRAQEEADKIRRDLERRIESKALELASAMVKNIFSPAANELLQRTFIKDVISEIQAVPAARFTDKTDNIKLTSAFALSREEKDSLSGILSDKLNITVNISEEVDAELIAGLILQVDSLIIDGSLSSRLKKIMSHLKRVSP